MAMSRDGLLPPFFSDINQRTQVPVKSTVVTGILATTLAFFFDVSQLAGMVSVLSTSDYTYIAEGLNLVRPELTFYLSKVEEGYIYGHPSRLGF